MKKIITMGGLIMGSVLAIKLAQSFRLYHFSPMEFGASLPFLSIDLLNKLDNFREALGSRVMISPAKGSLLRWDTKNESQHLYGRAADIMLPDEQSLIKALDIATKIGFTGIGLYPHWKPYHGLHVDIRALKKDDKIKTWVDVGKLGKHKYVSVNQAWTEGIL